MGAVLTRLGYQDASKLLEDGSRFVYASQPSRNEGFCDNRVTNTKYTLLTFLPKNFLEQFSRHINRYFLIIACLQLIDAITPVNPLSTFVPLFVIFSLSAAKEGYDDLGRAQADREANAREYHVVRDNVLTKIPSKDIHIGDIVRLYENEEVPCDLALLHTTDPNGICFVQTTNLDGETNLKKRTIPTDVNLSDEQANVFKGVIECSVPNHHCYNFDARLWLSSPREGQDADPDAAIAISGDQLLQQTILVRNVKYITGVAVYTGNETKFSKNKDVPPMKFTKADNLVNKLAIYLFLFQLVVVVVFGVTGIIWKESNGRNYSYLLFNSEASDDEWYEFLIIPARFLLLISTVIPISLKVTLDFARLFYSSLINWDKELHEAGEEPARANNTSISEDLGQVEYVLSDKTGTLTQNVMMFERASINGRVFQLRESTDGKSQAFPSLEKAIREQDQDALDFVLNIALNNGCVVDTDETGKRVYKGPSPDEEALLDAAAGAGITLEGRDGSVLNVDINGTKKQYVLMKELEFTSDRRRSSSVIQDKETGKLKLYIKGGDDKVFERLTTGQDTKTLNAHLEDFAMIGLRTLVFGHREVEQSEFDSWNATYDKANKEVFDRKEAIEKACELLEHDFILSGASAIEDKLQDGVPETIRDLREAGIRFWMLTGDKFTTALQIATACNLRQPDGPSSHLYEIEGESEEEVAASLKDALTSARLFKAKPDHDTCVIVRGTTINLAINGSNRQMFLDLTLMANSVVCCRFAPRQKAEIVKLVKSTGKLTLAIGDGGNDVSMIQAADVGVGIRGKEGLQAARASDYQFNYFRYLKRLLLVHGRYSYIRTSFIAQYSYYKSYVFCFFQLAFAFISGFSGATLFNSACVTAYNSILFIPILTFTLDQDVTPETAMTNPQVYRSCIKSYNFSLVSYGYWLLRGTYQGIVVFLVILSMYGISYHHAGNGTSSDYDTLGNVFYFAYMWVQIMTLLLELKSISRIHLYTILGFQLFTFLILLVLNVSISFNSLLPYYSVNNAFADPVFWLSNLVVTCLAVVPVYLVQVWNFNYRPTLSDHLRFLATNAKSVSSMTSADVGLL